MGHELPLGSSIPTTNNSEMILFFLLRELQEGRFCI